MIPRKAKRDISESEIVKALRKAGAFVYLMDRPVDLLCGIAGKTILFEVKTPGTQRGKTLTPAQKDFMANWRGSTIFIVKTPEEALGWLNVVRRAA